MRPSSRARLVALQTLPQLQAQTQLIQGLCRGQAPRVYSSGVDLKGLLLTTCYDHHALPHYAARDVISTLAYIHRELDAVLHGSAVEESLGCAGKGPWICTGIASICRTYNVQMMAWSTAPFQQIGFNLKAILTCKDTTRTFSFCLYALHQPCIYYAKSPVILS